MVTKSAIKAHRKAVSAKNWGKKKDPKKGPKKVPRDIARLERNFVLADACACAYKALLLGHSAKQQDFEMLEGKALLTTINLLDHVLKAHKNIHDYIRTLTAPDFKQRDLSIKNIKIQVVTPPDMRGSADFDITAHLPEQFIR